MSLQKHNKNNDLLRYAGLGAQLFVSLGIAVYVGHLLDAKVIRTTIPIFTMLLPLVVLVGMIISIIRNTSKKKEDDSKK